MNNILELKGISKHYPGVTALDNISMSFLPGEVHGIMGENGAGKSTLIKIVAGSVQADPGGQIFIDGKEFTNRNPQTSKEAGVGVIYQEFNLIPSMSVGENIFLGTNTGNPISVDFDYVYRKSEETLNRLGLKLNPRTLVRNLTTGMQQMVEVAKACSRECKVLIFDEPTASLTAAEADNLLDLIKELKEQGVCIIYITHRLDEVFRICDRVSVLRDGKYIDTKNVAEIDKDELIRLMVGRQLSNTFPERTSEIGEKIVEVKNLTGNGDFDINLYLRKGEILGLGGLIGAGRSEFAKMLCGAVKPTSGEIIVKGQSRKFRDCFDALECGIGLIPEDRKNEGVFLDYNLITNISMMSYKKYSKHLAYDQKKLQENYDKYVDVLQIKTPSQFQFARNLSGGNQQKVALAKVLAAETDILIFDEPTRGIDVGAKQEIYKLMNNLVSEGYSIIMISSEMEELLGMSDRIVVFYEGVVMGEVEREDFSQERVLALASGIKE